MKRTISKIVTALYPGGGLLQEDFFDRIRNRDKYHTEEESGINRTKKTVISVPGLGSNDRGHNPGAGVGLGRDENESSDKSVGSGYNDGGQADDETGPGNSPSGRDPYFTVDWDNELFSDLALKGQGSGRDSRDGARTHYKDLLKETPLSLRTKRYPVDRN